MKEYQVKTTFTFDGVVLVEAENFDKAKQIVNNDFGLVLGGNLQNTSNQIIDWIFKVHPVKKTSR